MKTLSFGGLGDSVIIFLKLQKLLKTETITEHRFIESNLKTLKWIKEYISVLPSDFEDIKFTFDCDPNYQKTYFSGKWNDYKALNTSWHGHYHFPAPDKVKLETPKDAMLKLQLNLGGLWELRYDVALQVSGGANANRKWRFNPLSLAKILRNQGMNVCLVGSDNRYVDDEDPDNFVNKTDLPGSMQAILFSHIFVGLSGFHNYWSLASGMNNIMLEESEEHTQHYIHPSWKNHLKMCKFGSAKEVLDGAREFKGSK